jgi:sortase A
VAKRRRWLRRTLLGVAVVSLATGVVLGGMLAYDLTWGNVVSDRTAKQLATELREVWVDERTTTRPERVALDAVTPLAEPAINEAFALLYVPRLADDVWGVPIIEGVKQKQLDAGMGHYPTSALPGEIGNFSLFGHRTGNGQPLYRFERLVAGDEVIVETENYWFVYVLKKDKIVSPEAIGVTSNAPLLELGIAPDKPYRVITLITCEPRWTDLQRWVWWGELQEVYAHSTPPAVITAVNDARDSAG